MLLATENQPEWKLSEGFGVQTQVYIWCVELGLVKQYLNIAQCLIEGEKQQIFQLRPCCFTETLLSSVLLNLLEGITRDWYIPVSWPGKREIGPLCVWWDKEEGKVWRGVF